MPMEGSSTAISNEPQLGLGASSQPNPAPSSSPAGHDDAKTGSTYHLKWIPWNSGRIPIVMQSINGPCPLIAIMNVSLLREKIVLPDLLEQITASQLLTYLGECLMDSIPASAPESENGALLNIEQNIHDAIEVLPKLETGLDVNIRFTGITDFEYTQEYVIFDLLRIPVYHGWLADPTLDELQNSIGKQSYNQLVDSIIEDKNSTDPEISAKILIAEEFLERTASQLTQHGLNELRSKIKDNEIGVLFRNNHFLTLLKRDGEIYTLVTDHGYLTEDNVIWEILDNIEGAGRFFNARFEPSDLPPKPELAIVGYNRKDNQVERSGSVTEAEQFNLLLDQTVADYVNEKKDHELAKRLQAEEEEAYDKLLRERYADDLVGEQQNPPIGHFNINDYSDTRSGQGEHGVSYKDHLEPTYRDLRRDQKQSDDIAACALASHDRSESATSVQQKASSPSSSELPSDTPLISINPTSNAIIEPSQGQIRVANSEDSIRSNQSQLRPKNEQINSTELPPQTPAKLVAITNRQTTIPTQSNRQQQQRSKQERNTRESNCNVS